MVKQLKNPIVYESIQNLKKVKSMTQLIILGISSFLLFFLGMLMMINVLLSKKNMQERGPDESQLARINQVLDASQVQD